MTLNDLIRDAQTIASQFSAGDIPLVQDVSLEVLQAGSTYAVGVFVAGQLTWKDAYNIVQIAADYDKEIDGIPIKEFYEEVIRRFNETENK